MWTNQIQETLNSKKRGDTAFRAKDFTTAIECYTQVSDLSEITASLSIALLPKILVRTKIHDDQAKIKHQFAAIKC